MDTVLWPADRSHWETEVLLRWRVCSASVHCSIWESRQRLLASRSFEARGRRTGVWEDFEDSLCRLINPDIHDALIELSKLDGAFVVRGDGCIRSAVSTNLEVVNMQEQNLTHLLASGMLIVALTALGLIAAHLVSRRVLAWAQSLKRIREARRQQLVTLIYVVQWILIVLLVGSAVLMALGTFGVNITPLLASVGVAGLALSLGAQSLIKDLIGGVLIIVENQYAIGDSITVGGVSGDVERITLRSTQVRALNGDLYIVPNGEVRVLANQTKGWSRAVVEVGVAYEEDLDHALDVLRTSAATFAHAPAFEASLLEPPQVLGPVSLGDSAVILRVAVKTEPGKQWEIGRELRKVILAACEREGVSLPYPRQEVWVRSAEREGTVSLEE